MDRLPEAILILIISLLPFKEAARTSFIAKPWRNLWRYISFVDIDMQDIIKQCGLCYGEAQTIKKFPSLHILCHMLGSMNKILFNRLTKITCFRIVLPSLNFNCDLFKNSIKIVMSQNSIEELTLVWNPLPHMIENVLLELPSGMFSCGTLRSLNLTNFSLLNASDLDGCSKVTTLDLDSVLLTEEVIHAINGLKLLEELMLSTFDKSEVADLKISVPSLRKVELRGFNVIRLEVCVPELDILILEDISCAPKCLEINTRKLTVFHADNVPELGNEDIVELVQNCKSLRELKLCSCQNIEKIEISHDNLRVLEIRKINLSVLDIRAKKLDVLVLAKLTCTSENIVIHTPNLTEFQSFTKSDISRDYLLRPADVLEYFIELFEAQPGSLTDMDCARTLENLRTLVGDFDLNSARDITVLSMIFGICTRLQNLHITVKESNAIPDPKMMVYGFWDKICYPSFAFHVRNVDIQGYRNTSLERDFVKHMITKAAFLEKLRIRVFDKASQQDTYVSSESLLTLPRASFRVSIVFVSFCGRHKITAPPFGCFPPY